MKENSTQAERLSLLIRYFKLNQTSFSRETGIKQANLSPVFKGRKELSRGMTNSILKRYDQLSANWLLKGVGPMFLEESGTANKTLQNELSEPGVPYGAAEEKGADPLEALRRLLNDFERRISLLEAEIHVLKGKK